MTEGLRGRKLGRPPQRDGVGLPPRPFLYTLDQVSVLLNISQSLLTQRYLYFEGRSIGTRKRGLMLANNIAPRDEKPEWRIAERELIRWLKYKGYRYYETGVVY